jgi:hypothetical protein
MKKVSIVFTAVIALSIMLISWNKAKTVEAAVHIDGFGCALFDGDGNLALATGTSAVITSQGIHIKCQVKGLPNSTGKAQHFDFDNTGFTCIGEDEPTWHETVSASGNATLTCNVPLAPRP